VSESLFLLLFLLGGLSGRKQINQSEQRNIRRLSEIAGELQLKLKRPVSIEEAIKQLTKRRKKGAKISDLAGSWKISDEEAQEIKTSIDEMWKK
jgi:predicted CopG family antitoxin